MTLTFKFLQVVFFAFLIQVPLAEASLPLPEFIYTGVDDPFNNGYTEERYKKVIAHFSKVYKPIVAEVGGEFKILSDWTDGAVNAWAWRSGTQYRLEIPGGLARYHLVNEAAFFMVICHEIGHLMGGEPASYDISFEGQADYYATADCMERVVEGWIWQESHQSPEAIDFCAASAAADSHCLSIVVGALQLAAVYAEPQNKPFPQIKTPDTKMVSATLQAHPEPQCRLDTSLAGYLEKDRPRCWYAPEFLF